MQDLIFEKEYHLDYEMIGIEYRLVIITNIIISTFIGCEWFLCKTIVTNTNRR